MKMRLLCIITSTILTVNIFGQATFPEKLKNEQNYDSLLNGMILRDVKSIERVLGTNQNIIDMQDWKTEIQSKNKGQLLTMHFLPGDITNQFSQFQVEYYKSESDIDLKIADNEFKSGKGIKLGLTEIEVKSILGEPNEIKNQEKLLIYWYRPENSLYFGNYYFKENRLIKFWFGFSYP